MADEKPTPFTAVTSHYGWTKPDIGASTDVWGGQLNGDLDQIDTVVYGIDTRAIPQASLALPQQDGTPSAGTHSLYARDDHVHPTDTNLYPITNPSGYQTAAQVTTALAPYALSTSVPSVPATSPLPDALVADIGSSPAYARADHVHPLPASGLGDVNDIAWFGDGSDGAVTITTTVTLARDMYYSNLTISGAGVLNAFGYRVFVSGVLDLSGAGAGAIVGGALIAAGNASGGSGGTAGRTTALFFGTQTFSSAGGTGVTIVSAGNPGSIPTTPTGVTSWLGGTGGSGGAGGTVTSNAGGAGGIVNPVNYVLARFRHLSTYVSPPPSASGGGYGAGVMAGGGGAGGSGTTGTASGGGGGGGYTGAIILIFARTINRGGSTAAGAINAAGGNGGTGASPGTSASQGSGGGGGGGGGGFAYLVYRFLTGSVATNAIDVSGGRGGNAATSTFSGIGGGGAGAGSVVLCNIAANTITASAGASTGTAASGTSGGAGVSFMVNL